MGPPCGKGRRDVVPAAAVLTVPIVVAAWNTRTWAGAILLPYNVWVALAASLSVGYALRN